MTAIKGTPWTVLSDLKGDRDVLKQIDEARDLLEALRKSLSE
jgi:hypothetical protein